MAEILVNITQHHPFSIQQNFVRDRPSNPSLHCRLYNLLTCTYFHYLIASIWTLLQTRQNCELVCPYALNETVIEENKEKRERFCHKIPSFYIDQS